MLLSDMKRSKFKRYPKVRENLKYSGTTAYKEFGQNFLVDKQFADFMVDSLDIQKDDFIIEIGPGMGALTELVLEKITPNNYLGIEIDTEKITHLKENYEGLNILNISILDFNIEAFMKETNVQKYKIIGSLPFNISKKIIQKFSEAQFRPELAVFMVQKEVGQDYIKDIQSGSTFLSIYLSQFWYVESMQIVPAASFFPVPKVDGLSMVLKAVHKNDYKLIKFVKRGFGQPRKKLGNVLSLPDTCPYKDKRAHELNLEDWMKLYKTFYPG